MAAVAWGNLVKIPQINDSNSASIKIWIKEHAKVGGNNEGRVFGNGDYNLAQIKDAAIVTVEEDSEICPETIDDQAETVKKALEILKNNETPLEEINKMIAEPEAPLEVANITDLLENTMPSSLGSATCLQKNRLKDRFSGSDYRQASRQVFFRSFITGWKAKQG